MEFNITEIQQCAKNFNLSCKIFNNIIYINSGRNDWVIEVENSITIKHKNKKEKKFRTHKEKKTCYNIYSALRWINSHENNVFALAKKGRRMKTNRLDMLFERIAQ